MHYISIITIQTNKRTQYYYCEHYVGLNCNNWKCWRLRIQNNTLYFCDSSMTSFKFPKTWRACI